MSTSAFAVVNLDTGLTAANYAKELVVPGTTALTGPGINVETPIGFGVSNGQQRYVRFDVSNGEFDAAVAPGNLDVGGNVNVAVSQGGAAGDSFVILQITATNDINQADLVTFALGAAGVVIQAANAPVAVTYSLYEDGVSAQAGGAAGRLATESATVAGLVTGLALSAVPNTSTVDVEADPAYTAFTGATVAGTSTTVAQIGTVSIGAAASVLDPGTGIQVLYADLVAAGTALVLTGADLTAAVTPATVSTGLFLAPDGTDCTTAGIAATSRDATSAAFVTNAVARVGAPLCFTVSGANTVAIPAQTFTVGADITAAVGSTAVDMTAINAGAFDRNGLVLKAAFGESTGAAGVSSAVHLTNTSNAAASFTVRCMLNSGSAAGTPGAVPANTAVRLGLTSSLGCTSDGTLRGIEVTFAAREGDVIGSIVRQNVSTGQASFDGMVGNK